MTKLLVQNKKIKNSSNDNLTVFNFGIPAFRSRGGIATCPMAGTCAAGCYAKSGAYLWDNVANAYEFRLKATQSKQFEALISKELELILNRKTTKNLHVRIHDSGDFYSIEYAKKWFNVMRLFPKVKFYAYTKMVAMFKGMTLPENFTLIYSLGGKQDSLIDRFNDRHSKVFENKKELKSMGYIDASHDDMKAIGKNKRIGLVYHGQKSFKNTAWDRVTS